MAVKLVQGVKPEVSMDPRMSQVLTLGKHLGVELWSVSCESCNFFFHCEGEYKKSYRRVIFFFGCKHEYKKHLGEYCKTRYSCLPQKAKYDFPCTLSHSGKKLPALTTKTLFTL